MALILPNRYPGRFDPPSVDYPQGSFKNRTTPTAKDGSYLERDWANDKEGFFQSLLSAASITANGAVDKVGASQYYSALLSIVDSRSVDKLNAAIATVPAASNINLTTGAPNTSQIVISGSGANIAGFTVAANRFFVVRFAGQNNLINSSSLVTNSGLNITASAGDSCLIRATAANTVEILMFKKGGVSQSLTNNGYRVINDGTGPSLIIQWGTTDTIPINSDAIVTFPIAFPNAAFSCLAGGAISTRSSGAAQQTAMNVFELSATQFKVSNDDLAMPARWMAVGW